MKRYSIISGTTSIVPKRIALRAFMLFFVSITVKLALGLCVKHSVLCPPGGSFSGQVSHETKTSRQNGFARKFLLWFLRFYGGFVICRTTVLHYFYTAF
jgi:hypothetical protein